MATSCATGGTTAEDENIADDTITGFGPRDCSDDIKIEVKSEVQQKLRLGEYCLAENQKDATRNKQLWINFQLVVKKDGDKTEYVFCKNCKDVLKHHPQKSGTTHLRKHLEGGKCKKGDKLNATQTAMTSFLTATANSQIKHAKAIARKSAMDWCVMDVKPFSMMKGAGLRAFGQAMIDIGAKSGKVNIDDILPDRWTIANDVQSEFDKKRKELAETLQSVTANGQLIGATTDLWTDDIKHQHYMSLTLHFEQNWKIVSRLAVLKAFPAAIKKTAVNLRSELLSAFMDFDMKADTVRSNIVFTTDCGANIVKALSPFRWIGCACHQLATVLRHVFAMTKQEETFINSLLEVVDEEDESTSTQLTLDSVESEIQTVHQINKQFAIVSQIVAYLKRSGHNAELPKAVYQENSTR